MQKYKDDVRIRISRNIVQENAAVMLYFKKFLVLIHVVCEDINIDSECVCK